MKNFKFMVCMLLSLSFKAFAIDVISFELRENMMNRVESQLEKYCSKVKEDLRFLPPYQILDSYNKYNGDSDEGGIRYYYAPKIAGAAFCSKTQSVLSWVVHSGFNVEGELEPVSVTVSDSRID